MSKRIEQPKVKIVVASEILALAMVIGDASVGVNKPKRVHVIEQRAVESFESKEEEG